MEYRKFGSTDLMVSEIGFGCNKLGNSIFAKTNFTDNSSLLNSAFHKGITLYDVAPTYSYGEAESILGKVFSSKRHEIVISTKVGRLPSSLARYGSTIRHLHPIISPLFSPFKSKLKKRSSPRFDFSSSHIIKSAEESLKRLQTDYIDIFFLHNPSLDVIQKGEVFKRK